MITKNLLHSSFLRSLFAVLVLLPALSAPAFASKIAVFDPDIALLATEGAKKRFEKMKKSKSFKKLESQLKGYEADIRSMQKEAKKNQLTWSETQKQEFQKKMSYVLEDRELALKKVATERNQILAQLNQEYGKAMEEATKQIIQAQKIDLLIKPAAVWHVTPSLNITSQVVDILNKK